MTHTHLVKVLKSIENNLKEPKKTLFKKDKNNESLESYLKKVNSSCYICDKIDNTFNRYVDSFFYLLKKEKEFSTLFQNTNFFCLEHFQLLLEISENKLNGDLKIEFTKTLFNIQHKYMQELIGDIDWFIKKYDYRYKDEPYKNSKDSLNRSIGFVTGRYLE